MKKKTLILTCILVCIPFFAKAQDRQNEVRQKLQLSIDSISNAMTHVSGWSKMENTEGKFWKQSDLKSSTSYLPCCPDDGFQSLQTFKFTLEGEIFYLLSLKTGRGNQRIFAFKNTSLQDLQNVINNADGKSYYALPIEVCDYLTTPEEVNSFDPKSFILNRKSMIRLLLTGVSEYLSDNFCKGCNIFIIKSQILNGEKIIRFDVLPWGNSRNGPTNHGFTTIENDYYELKEADFNNLFKYSKYISESTYIQNGSDKIKSKDYFGAITEFRNAIKYYPNNPYHYNMIGFCEYSIRNYSPAISYYTSAIEKTSEGNDQAILYLNRGDAKLGLKDSIGAISDYKAAIQKSSNTDTYLSNRIKLGLLFFKMNKYEEAKENFKNIRYNPTVNLCYKNMAYYYFEKKDFENTIKTCSEILYKMSGLIDEMDGKESNPADRPSIYLLRATAYACLGKIDLDDVQYAIRLNPNLVDAYLLNAKFKEAKYKEISMTPFKDFDGAMLDYDKVLEINPNNVNAFIGRAKLKIWLNDYKNALTDCDNAIQLDQNSGEAYCIRGFTQVKLHKKKLGCEDFQKSLELGYNAVQEYIKAYCK